MSGRANTDSDRGIYTYVCIDPPIFACEDTQMKHREKIYMCRHGCAYVSTPPTDTGWVTQRGRCLREWKREEETERTEERTESLTMQGSLRDKKTKMIEILRIGQRQKKNTSFDEGKKGRRASGPSSCRPQARALYPTVPVYQSGPHRHASLLCTDTRVARHCSFFLPMNIYLLHVYRQLDIDADRYAFLLAVQTDHVCMDAEAGLYMWVTVYERGRW